ncbi:transcriptional regulator, IscR/Rrf2 family [Campylobacter blaseri]|uniref:Transcriptional regulator n=1 Tax=Campylobacter blaseri TaxID=2042961 RepID=A0A2P8R228_9BACT|nr:Rrf2 family transcriptional regulator [Campylobacter blaseri]PSM52554.1 transcriptional regulator [Campylobacter blaseri]PSM54202.1 transcriptional regulator [Campylobacter blaseri]QKF85853.1 transcriptional regulator, IscR/Rrf2 family [Campylobacter blaseri]
MLFTKASEYALLSLIYLAQKDSAQGVEVIANELNISKSFLAKILQNMAKEGILKSTRGVNGGFELAHKPKDINLKDIVLHAEKHPTSVFECSSSRGDCPSDQGEFCKIWKMFNTLQIKVDEFLETITLQDIIIKKEF